MFVKFRQYIVKQQHRRILYDLPYQLDLRQFQRKCRCPLLPLRSESADVDPTCHKTDIIPVRSHRGTLHPDIALPVLLKRRLKRKCSASRLIRKADPFPASRQFMVNVSDYRIDLLDKPDPSLNNLFSILNQLHIPYIQSIFKFRFHIYVF